MPTVEELLTFAPPDHLARLIEERGALEGCLDWLEGQGLRPTLQRLGIEAYGITTHLLGTYLEGKTRIEAVVRACVEVLRSPQPPSSEPDQSTPPQDLKR